MKIFIDPGHGGESPGAVYKGRSEKDDTLRLSRAVRDILIKYKDIEVMLSREDDSEPTLLERTALANRFGADYFLSVHRNAFSPEKAQGAEIWCFSKIAVGGETYNKAKTVLDRLCEKTGFINRGVKLGAPNYDDFAVNKYTDMHSGLLEVGFIDNSSDNIIFDEKFTEMANALADALLEAVGYQKEPIPGDVDDDGKITASDARSILRAATGLEEIPVEKGDLDGDGKITASDARAALRKSAGLE